MKMFSTFVAELVGAAGIEPTKCLNQNQVPYHLATPQRTVFFQKQNANIIQLLIIWQVLLKKNLYPMKFFIVELRYLVPLEVIAPHTEAHRAFLKTLYEKEILLMSGPAVPRTKGLLIARHESGEELARLLKSDPYQQNSFVEAVITEFAPANYLPSVSQWLLKD